MITLATIKTLLNITTTDYDAQLTLLIPMVENDVRRILNNQFNEKVDCVLKSGSTAYPYQWITETPAPIEIGRVVNHPNIPDETHITTLLTRSNCCYISQATTGAGLCYILN